VLISLFIATYDVIYFLSARVHPLKFVKKADCSSAFPKLYGIRTGKSVENQAIATKAAEV
jgi:hypothetical protein